MRLLNIAATRVLIVVSTYILLVVLGALRNLIWGYGEAPDWIHWVLGIGGSALATPGIVTAVRMLVRAARRS